MARCELHIEADGTIFPNCHNAPYVSDLALGNVLDEEPIDWKAAARKVFDAVGFPDEDPKCLECKLLACSMADITGRTVETVVNAQEVGAIGTALVVAAGIQGADVHELSRRFVKVERTYVPDRGNKKVYERNYKVFKKLYKSNAAHFRALNSNMSE